MVYSRKGKPNKVKADFGSADGYKYYCKRFGNPHELKQGEYGNVLKDFFSEVAECMIMENMEYEMPASLGSISVKKKKRKPTLDENGELNTKTMAPDYKATRKLWAEDEEAKKNKTLVFHTNDHTDGFRHKWYWSKLSCNVRHASVYSFKACDHIRKKLTDALKDASLDIDFYELKRHDEHGKT